MGGGMGVLEDILRIVVWRKEARVIKAKGKPAGWCRSD